MSIRKIVPASSRTLSSILKEQKLVDKVSQKLAQEKQLAKITDRVAKSMVPKISKVQLFVNSGDVYDSSRVVNDQIGRLAISDSVWAPWSKLFQLKR